MSDDTSKTTLTAFDGISLLRDRAQRCRENGDSDMRIIVYMADGLLDMIDAGKSREEILADFAYEEDEGE